ncbi:hypothetical protein GCM10023229_16230 [Flavisolibacter ginsenosidimutans]
MNIENLYLSLQMAKAKKKPGKYDITLKVNATFEQLIAASVQNINLKKMGEKSPKKKK